MNATLTVVNRLTKIEQRTYNDKTGVKKTLLSCSIIYRRDSIKNQQGQNEYENKFLNFAIALNDFSKTLKVGDIVCVNGELDVSLYTSKQGTSEINVSLKNVNINKILDADRITAYQQEYAAVPQQGYVAPQQGYAAPQQGYVAPQQGYAAPQQGYAAPQQGYAAAPQETVDPFAGKISNVTEEDLPF